MIINKLTKKATIISISALMMLSAGATAQCITPQATGPITSKITHRQLRARASQIYDVSEWQKRITNREARQLKHEVPFMILRAQYGTGHQDIQLRHNIKMMKKYHIPYGVYSYAIYENPIQARTEANELKRRAPHARFYINDCEENDAGGQLQSSTAAWANQMKHLTKRPVVLYSDAYFLSSKLSPVLNDYNAIWVASFGARPNVRYHYDLWQFSDNFYSRALGKYLDASTFAKNSKPLKFWIGNTSKNKHHRNQVNVKKITSNIRTVIRKHARKPKRQRRHRHHRRNRARVKIEKYYTGNSIHFLRARRNLWVYNNRGKHVQRAKRGTIFMIYGLRQRKNHKGTIAMIVNGGFITGEERAVKPIH